MLYWLYLIIFSLKILKDDEDEAPYDRTYRDKSDMIVPEPRYGNSLPKYGNKTKADAIQDENPWTRQNAKKANKAESEEEGEEEEEGRNPYSQAKLAQQRKLQKQKENQRNEDRKEPNQSNSDDPPSEHLLKRDRERKKKKRLLLHLESRNRIIRSSLNLTRSEVQRTFLRNQQNSQWMTYLPK